ncbi:acetate/propionate family kinase [Aquimarina rhabdastrellae]
MQILVLNSGSSSIKFQLFLMPEAKVICSGLVERIGLKNAKITYTTTTQEIENETQIKDHTVGLKLIAQYLMDNEVGVIKDVSEIEAVGHRVVHGGSEFATTTLITTAVKAKIKELFSLAPLHNPANLEGIEVAETIFPEAKQIAVFDTAYHQTIPEKAYKYAIPNALLDEHDIRLYGFHGTSHKYVVQEAQKLLEKTTSNIITIHLGNGCSMTAVKNGESIDHTLGFAPMNGLIMGTRSGDIDPAIVFYLVNNKGYTLEDVNTMLQKESGMLGLTGYSDLRDIEAKAAAGDKACKLALEMSAYRIKKFIGAYVAVMNGLDAIVFTAGIGENSSMMRKLVCQDMEYFGIALNEEENNIRAKKARSIHKESSKIKIMVIPTNEELEIAKQSFELL